MWWKGWSPALTLIEHVSQLKIKQLNFFINVFLSLISHEFPANQRWFLVSSSVKKVPVSWSELIDISIITSIYWTISFAKLLFINALWSNTMESDLQVYIGQLFLNLVTTVIDEFNVFQREDLVGSKIQPSRFYRVSVVIFLISSWSIWKSLQTGAV